MKERTKHNILHEIQESELDKLQRVAQKILDKGLEPITKVTGVQAKLEKLENGAKISILEKGNKPAPVNVSLAIHRSISDFVQSTRSSNNPSLIRLSGKDVLYKLSRISIKELQKSSTQKAKTITSQADITRMDL